MESVASNIQVLLQAAEFLERREREAEHGYASLFPHRSPGPVHRKRKGSPQALGAFDSGRSVHNELEKRRRAQLKRCLEQLKQQMPLGADCARYTTLSLLRRARMHIQKLEEQEQRAQRLKEQLRSKQQSLQQQLEQLRAPAGAGERERLRADSLDSSGLSSERSDSDQEELEVDVESVVFGGEAELLRGFRQIPTPALSLTWIPGLSSMAGLHDLLHRWREPQAEEESVWNANPRIPPNSCAAASSCLATPENLGLGPQSNHRPGPSSFGHLAGLATSSIGSSGPQDGHGSGNPPPRTRC
ncbi:hypothetical protein QTO34_016017 [Cnephaeus nilssonii]|uniref:Max dimerization protein 3 n=1 Tax=Cnephaeus nilssonii TaxID=3371016 RepID=A0AA40I5B1_CNENI|nr:hypothetical protein QTO34_016017 [Eptesicus nilssonii]